MKNNLIDLLYEGEDKCNYADCGQCEYLGRESCGFHLIADHLIANGVTILTETKCNTINVKLPKEIVVHPYGGKWIPVSERLPEHFGTFLVAIDEVHGENRVSVDSADFDPYEKSWKTFNYFCAGFKITHWMPLPEPPNT